MLKDIDGITYSNTCRDVFSESADPNATADVFSSRQSSILLIATAPHRNKHPDITHFKISSRRLP